VESDGAARGDDDDDRGRGQRCGGALALAPITQKAIALGFAQRAGRAPPDGP
jgi:hypothetical protein